MNIVKADSADTAMLESMYSLFAQSIDDGDMVHKKISKKEFAQKIFAGSSYVEPVVLAGSQGEGFICGCTDRIQKKRFMTMIIVNKAMRQKGLGTALVKALEKEFYKDRLSFENSGSIAVELSFFNPSAFEWKIPGYNASHPNVPGVDPDSLAYVLLEHLGYKTFAVQNSYFLSLENYVPEPEIVKKKRELEAQGITFEIYNKNIHKGMEAVLKELGNPLWEKEVLSEAPAAQGGRPVLVPVLDGHVQGFTGPLEVAFDGRGYFAGIGIGTRLRGKGVAKVLFCELCTALKAMGASFMTLFTGENNPARNIYEAAGFTVVRTWADMRKTLCNGSFNN